MTNLFIKSEIQQEKGSNFIFYNTNIFNLTEDRIINFSDAGLYLTLIAIVRSEKDPVLTIKSIKERCGESVTEIKKILKKLHKINLLFYIKNKKGKIGYIITEYQETNADMKKFLEQKLPDWVLIEKED